MEVRAYDQLGLSYRTLPSMDRLNAEERERIDAELDAEYLPRGGWYGECQWMIEHALTEEDREFWQNELEQARLTRRAG